MEKWLSEDKSLADMVRTFAASPYDLPTSTRSLGRALDRWGIARPQHEQVAPERPGVSINGDSAEVVSKASAQLITAKELMEERGLDPEEWEESGLTINQWDSPTGEVLRQLKLHLRRVKPLSIAIPARLNGPRYKVRGRLDSHKPRLVVFTGDQQAPHHEPHLHELFCEWLKENQPNEGVLIGDTVDFPTVSRHPKNPEWHPPVQDCVDAGYALLHDYREAGEDVRWKKLIGNHDERLRRSVIDVLNSELYTLTRAKKDDLEEDPLLDVGHILRLDELDIEIERPHGDYENAQINVSAHLAARHGWIARKGSGASALATLEHLGFSVVVGHTHRQSLVHKTRHDINGELTTLAACETGCMCLISEGLGYAVAPDWQNGFATAIVWPDGTFKIDVATYVNGVLLWRDQKYS